MRRWFLPIIFTIALLIGLNFTVDLPGAMKRQTYGAEYPAPILHQPVPAVEQLIQEHGSQILGLAAHQQDEGGCVYLAYTSSSYQNQQARSTRSTGYWARLGHAFSGWSYSTPELCADTETMAHYASTQGLTRYIPTDSRKWPEFFQPDSSLPYDPVGGVEGLVVSLIGFTLIVILVYGVLNRLFKL